MTKSAAPDGAPGATDCYRASLPGGSSIAARNQVVNSGDAQDSHSPRRGCDKVVSDQRAGSAESYEASTDTCMRAVTVKLQGPPVIARRRVAAFDRGVGQETPRVGCGRATACGVQPRSPVRPSHENLRMPFVQHIARGCSPRWRWCWSCQAPIPRLSVEPTMISDVHTGQLTGAKMPTTTSTKPMSTNTRHQSCAKSFGTGCLDGSGIRQLYRPFLSPL